MRAVLAAIVVCWAGHAAAQAGETAPPPPPAIRAEAPMTITLHHGSGPFGQARWVQLAGRIVPGTAQRFAQLAGAWRREADWLVIESLGGDAAEAVLLGRAVRAGRWNTAVGRSLRGRGPAGWGERVVHAGGRCVAACVYALLGGLERLVPGDAEVAPFYRGLAAEHGGPAPVQTMPAADFARAQVEATEIAIWLAEAGADPAFMRPIIEHTAPVAMAGEALAAAGLARHVPSSQLPAEPGGWWASLRADRPELRNLGPMVDRPDLRLDVEAQFTCEGGDPALRFRFSVAHPLGDAFPYRGLALHYGDESMDWRAEEGAEPATFTAGEVWGPFAWEAGDEPPRALGLTVVAADGAEARRELPVGRADWFEFVAGCRRLAAATENAR